MLVTIGGKRWRLEFGSAGPNNDGHCDPPNAKGKRLIISKKATKNGRTLMETALHEALHAADWTKDEEWVEQTAADLERLLWKLGYRRTE